MIDWTVLLTGLIGAIVGTFLGAFIVSYFSDRKNRKLRNIAIKALKTFYKYAKGKGKYAEATEEFNKTLTLAEKRTVLVSLHKIGLPIEVPQTGIIDITKITFEQTEIDKGSIDEMIGQINSGYCDNFFYIDPDTHFSSDFRIKALRNLGKRFVNEIVSTSKKEKDSPTINYSRDINSVFTTGELRSINVLRQVLLFEADYDNQGNFKKERIASLVKEIEMGLWDNYLLMPLEAYNNLNGQNMVSRLVSSLPVFNQSGSVISSNQTL